MIKSMTGYGKCETQVANTRCTVEIKSVNGRFLEFNARLPKEWADKEQAIRELVRSRIDRGSVNVFIRYDADQGVAALHVDNELAAAYISALRSLKEQHGLSGDVSVENVAQYAPIFEGEPANEEEVDVWPELSAAVSKAIDALDEMRVREGNEMTKDLKLRLDLIEQGLTEVEAITSERIPAERIRLRERVAQVVDDGNIDEQRLHLEIVLLADKLDVSEECVRLKSHLKHFRDDMKSGGAIGRKLNFQMQEMNREVNTIGSKSNDVTIARLVVGMKEELERIREQVQNVE